MKLAPAAALPGLVLLLFADPGPAEEPARYEITNVDTAHGDREFHLLWPEGAPGAVGDESVVHAADDFPLKPD